MTIFQTSGLPNTATCTSLKNIQVKKSKYKVSQATELLETAFLHPLIKGVDINPFHVSYSGLIVPFPYTEKDTRLPIGFDELSKKAPKLASFYQRFKKLILSQTNYNERIIGRVGEFYALARVGSYSFAKTYVVFRDNTKWGAAVVSDIKTEWGGLKHPLFQNHCVSICEDSEGNYITEDEAHFICGILNAPATVDFIVSSSDARSFPVRPRIYIPKYDVRNRLHAKIVRLSRDAHLLYNDSEKLRGITRELNDAYLRIVSNGARKQNRK